MTNELGAEYESVFAQLLAAHAEEVQRHPRAPERWCAFWPMIGQGFRPGGLMVVGKALNGWEETEFKREDLACPDGITRVVGKCKASFATAGRKPTWVEQCWDSKTGYRTSRSKFWQTARLLAERRGDTGQDWSSALVWTNMVRVSPAIGGNGPTWSRAAQLGYAAKLLDCELKALQPSLAVFLTGRKWFEELQEKTGLFRVQQVHQELVYYAGLCGKTRLVVADHPRNRSPVQMLDQIVEHWPVS